MATKLDDETNGCTFQWKIENISHSWLKLGEPIKSPAFIAEALENTKWFLSLYPMGYKDENNISLFLHRKNDCIEPNDFEVKVQLSLLDKDDLCLKKKTYCTDLHKMTVLRFLRYENREKIFVVDKEAFLPQDTLTVQCTIWNTVKDPVNPKRLYARTVFKVNRRSFEWKIDKIHFLKSGLQNEFKDNSIEFDLAFNEGIHNEKKLDLKINSCDESIKYFSFTTSIIDFEGKKEYCGTHEYFMEDLKGKVLSTLLLPKKLFENKRQYLPEGILSLGCEYVYSDGTIIFQHCGSEMMFPNMKNEVIESRNLQTIKQQECPNTSELVNDLKSMYNDAIFSDNELRTSTQTFPVHMAMLSARSPVFRSMFNNDMKEKNSKHVDVTDLDDETMHQMLLYIYTNSLEEMQFEGASKLYVAADKYQIMSLKSRCATFLKDNLCPTKACEVLLLSDIHHDKDLKSFVIDYILEHDKEVFGSQEWKDFMDTNLKLAADIMYKRVFP